MLVLATVDAPTRAKATNLVLLALHLVLSACLDLVAKAVQRAAHVGEDLILKTFANFIEEMRRRAFHSATGHLVVGGRRVHFPPLLRRLDAHILAHLKDEDERACIGTVNRDGLPLVRGLHKLRKVATAPGADAFVQVDDLRRKRVEYARVYLRNARVVPPILPLWKCEVLGAPGTARIEILPRNGIHVCLCACVHVCV